MTHDTYDAASTALLVIDPYNDFISVGGKVWPRISAIAEANHCVQHMLEVLQAARKAGLRIAYALHRRYRQGDYESWNFIAPVQKAAWVEATVRFAVELGYDVTMVRDATADYSDEHMRAALDTNIPSYASIIVTASEAIERIRSVEQV